MIQLKWPLCPIADIFIIQPIFFCRQIRRECARECTYKHAGVRHYEIHTNHHADHMDNYKHYSDANADIRTLAQN